MNDEKKNTHANYIIPFAVLVAVYIALYATVAVVHAQTTTSTSTATSTITGTVVGTSTATSTASSTANGTITASTTGTSTATSTGTSTATSTSATLDMLIAQLRDLASRFPDYFNAIAAFISQLLNGSSSGTATSTATSTIGMTGGAYIDQNGGFVRAGESIDFGGHGFMHEEQIAVTMGGVLIATAHADGGGNFSTGSLRVPNAPGTYTYVFTGERGDMAHAVLTVR
jgi:hypothetical protein